MLYKFYWINVILKKKTTNEYSIQYAFDGRGGMMIGEFISPVLSFILLELGASFMNTKITSENILIFYINNSLIIIKILFTF